MNPQELLHTSHRILITIPSQSSLQEKEAALVMLFSLLRLGKSVEMEGMPVVSRVLSQIPQKKEKTFAVTAKGLAPWVSKVYYEKDERDLRLYFTLQDKNLSEYMLTVGEQRHDLVFIVGDTEAVHKSVEPASRIVAFNDIQRHDNLVAALISEEDRAIAALCAKGFLSAEFAFNDSLVLTFSRKDFQDANSGPSVLPTLISFLRQHGENRLSYICAFEEAGPRHFVRVLLHTDSEKIKDALLRHGQGESKGAWTLARTRFSSLKEARQTITQSTL